MLQAQIFNLETERRRRAHKKAQPQQKLVLDKALSTFKMHARKREINDPDYRDCGYKWNELSQYMQKWIDDFNRLPKETRPAVLEAVREFMMRNQLTAKIFVTHLNPSQQ